MNKMGSAHTLQDVLAILNEQEKRLAAYERNFIWLKMSVKKLRGEKLHIVFICHRPQYWLSLQSVYEAFMEDEEFAVTIVAVPYKLQLSEKNNECESYYDEGAYDFFSSFPCHVVNGYNRITGEWYDLESLDPDFLFFQAPYDSRRPESYSSHTVSRYVHIGYMHYAISGLPSEYAPITYRESFAGNVTLHFVETKDRLKFVRSVLDRVSPDRPHSIFYTGHPKLDNLERYKNCEGPSWPRPRESGAFRILWTPRWTMRENASFFLDYKDKFTELAAADKGIDLLFRPHPQAFLELRKGKKLTQKEIAAYLTRYSELPNAAVDESPNYAETLYSSDILVSDYSSLLAEYLFTCRPIIFCCRNPVLSDLMSRLSSGFYWAQEWKDVYQTLNMLRKGDDPLLEKRLQIIREEFFRPKCGSGVLIKEKVKQFLHNGMAGAGRFPAVCDT